RLIRLHHRIKTHGLWDVKQPYPGIFVWRDPHGRFYLVDHTGTRSLRPRCVDERAEPAPTGRGGARAQVLPVGLRSRGLDTLDQPGSTASFITNP
ncbi:MAG: hypothetical protein ACXVW3_04855, partial [Nocardioidaceae bacterium]